MKIKVDDLIKSLEKHKGKTIVGIQISDINLNLEIKGINQISVDNAWAEGDSDEVELSLCGYRN